MTLQGGQLSTGSSGEALQAGRQHGYLMQPRAHGSLPPWRRLFGQGRPQLDLTPPVEVVDYDLRWPLWFNEISAQLAPYLTEVPHRIEHVGSTAVPGLAAKPIIDIDVVVPSTQAVRLAISSLATAGCQHREDLGIPGRESFALPPGARQYHHLYVVVDGSKPHRDHILLRDHLRRNAADRELYATLKRDLAHLLLTDRAAYLEAKAGLIKRLIKAGRTYATETDTEPPT
ncbi:GrpB family protein [Kribbella turkmenica]|uniref:GrpB family protein n=1 Tax=Kribbella turkmenica TaxID=2530375 RepID=A0A4R4XFJ1_9ACTN|nr:GrpB family protein [Kribbella turkmenica]TDD29212.1 GrpB family protein [Kribbella turkmenica]